MSDNTGDRAYARDARLQPAVAWIALLVFRWPSASFVTSF